MQAKKYGDRAHVWPRSATKPPRIFLTALPSYDPVAFHWAHARSFRTTENSQPVQSKIAKLLPSLLLRYCFACRHRFDGGQRGLYRLLGGLLLVCLTRAIMGPYRLLELTGHHPPVAWTHQEPRRVDLGTSLSMTAMRSHTVCTLLLARILPESPTRSWDALPHVLSEDCQAPHAPE